ncbi:MAG: hypothetical protein ABIL16_07245 [candidate division WOR-3 bacterium]
MGLLILSGIFNLSYRGFVWEDFLNVRLWEGSFGRTLGIISALHDFVIGPKATGLWMKNPESADTLRMRKLASWIGRINLLLALIVVMLGVILVRGGL